MTTRKELTEAVGARYRQARARERTTILDEFVALTGYHRKHAITVLAGEHLQERARAPRRVLSSFPTWTSSRNPGTLTSRARMSSTSWTFSRTPALWT